MRSALIGELGQAPVVTDTGEPAAAAGETIVTIEAVALNPLDLTVGSGAFYGGHPPLPYAIGCEAAGRIEDGSPVYLFGDGRGVSRPGFAAERVAVPQDLLLRLPPPPPQHRYVQVAGDVLLIAVGSSMVVDAIEDITR